MSINVSSLLLRTCKVGTLTVELDFARLSDRKRSNVIRALEGKAKTNAVASIRRMYGVPFITKSNWYGIPSDSEFWSRYEESIALIKIKGRDKTEIDRDDYFGNRVRESENQLENRPSNGYYWGDDKYNPLRFPPITSYIEPIPLDNPVHELIAKLKAGENPSLIIKLDEGLHNEYQEYKRR